MKTGPNVPTINANLLFYIPTVNPNQKSVPKNQN